ncbi:MAG TPA: hypothetical protein VIW94_01905 [Acidimicrobiia bacterium]
MSTETANERNSIGDVVRSIGFPLVTASALASVFGIVIAQFLDDMGDGILAEILGGEAVLYNNRVEFTGATDVAWAGGFLLTLVIGLLLLFTYPSLKGQDLSRLTFLWITIQVLRQSLAQALMLPFGDGGDLRLAYDTFDLPPGLDWVVGAAGGVGLILVGLGAASAFLAYAAHRRKISTSRKRFLFVLWVVLVPAVASVFLAIPYFSPDAGSGVVPSLPLTAVLFLFTLAAAPGTTNVIGPETERTYPWPYGMAGTLIVLLVFYVVVLRNGVSIDPRLWG